MMQSCSTPKQLHLMSKYLLLTEAFLPQRKGPMQFLQSAPALLTEIFMAAQAAFGHV